MEVPQFYIDKMFDTPRESVYVVGDDLEEWKTGFLNGFRGLTGYPPSIKDWVDASCEIAPQSIYRDLIALRDKGVTTQSGPWVLYRLSALEQILANSAQCEGTLWAAARRKNG